MRALVLVITASLAVASARAGELPKQGEQSWTGYFVAVSENGGQTEWVGIRRTDSGDTLFDRMGVRGIDLGGHGSEVQIDASGDQISSTWSGSEFHWVGGTGKYAGISGDGTFSCIHPRSPDGRKLAICQQRASWKLP